jgi:hypothetical protein
VINLKKNIDLKRKRTKFNKKNKIKPNYEGIFDIKIKFQGVKSKDKLI